MSGLGAAMAGGNGKRPENDFYPTPPEPVIALLEAEWSMLRAHSGGRVWEPACGDGAIARVLEGHGFEVAGSDLVGRGYGRLLDFLQAKKALAPAIVTNPPYGSRLPEKFLRHAMTLKVGYVALLLKATYWHAAERLPLFGAHPPAAVYPLSWRVDFLGRGAPTMDVTWFVWRSHQPGHTAFRPLPRPAGEQTADLFGGAS